MSKKKKYIQKQFPFEPVVVTPETKNPHIKYGDGLRYGKPVSKGMVELSKVMRGKTVYPYVIINGNTIYLEPGQVIKPEKFGISIWTQQDFFNNHVEAE